MCVYKWWWWFSHQVMSNSCDPMDCSLPVSSVCGISQARILKWVAISFSRGSSPSRNQTQVSCIAGRFFTEWVTREAVYTHTNTTLLYTQHCKLTMRKWSEVVQSCPTLRYPMDWSLQGSSVHGIFQARVLEWVAISFSRGSSRAREWTQVSRIAGRCSTIWAIREAPKMV